MKHMTFRERRYRRAHLDCVRHITLDPKGPGVVRIHMIPPRDDTPDAPFLLLLNGAQLVPLNLSWAILLANLMDQLQAYEGQDLAEDQWEALLTAAWFVTRLNTNGRLLTPELCAGLYEASLDSVQVTLYSAEGNIHNQLVGVNGFSDTVQGIRHAVEAGLIVSVNTPLCSLNTHYAETLRFAHSLGVRYATCSGLIPSGSACGQESRATALTPEQLTDVLRQAVDTAEELGMELDFTSPGWLEEETLRSLGLNLIPSCGACLSNMAVTPDGKVVPCQSWLSDEPLGDLLHDDWADIWNSPRCAAIRAESAKLEHICQLKGKEAAE